MDHDANIRSCQPAYITKLTSEDQLGKLRWIDPSTGRLQSKSNNLVEGIYAVEPIFDIADLVPFFNTLTPNDTITMAPTRCAKEHPTGAVRTLLALAQWVYGAPQPGQKGATEADGKALLEPTGFLLDGDGFAYIARSLASFQFPVGLPGIFPLDLDDVPEHIHGLVELDMLIGAHFPAWVGVKRLWRRSSGSQMTVDGKVVSKLKAHAFCLVEDASMIPSIGAAMEAALAGVLKLDKKVWSPERPFYVAPGIYQAPLEGPNRTPLVLDGAQFLDITNIVRIEDRQRVVAALSKTYESIELTPQETEEVRARYERILDKWVKRIEALDPDGGQRDATSGAACAAIVKFVGSGVIVEEVAMEALLRPLEEVGYTESEFAHDWATAMAKFGEEDPRPLGGINAVMGGPAPAPAPASMSVPADPSATWTRKQFEDWIIDHAGNLDVLTRELPIMMARNVAMSDVDQRLLVNLIKRASGGALLVGDIRSMLADAKRESGRIEEDMSLTLAEQLRSLRYSNGQDVITENGDKPLIQVWETNGLGGGVWKVTDIRHVRQQLIELSREMRINDRADSVFIGKAYTAFMDITTRKGVVFGEKCGDFANLRNGEAYLEGGTWKVRPAQREHYCISQLPGSLVPGAQCPRFMKALDQMFEGHEDADDLKLCVLETMGGALIAGKRYDTDSIWVGGGANGKSLLLAALQFILGRDNWCSVQPSQFENKFQLGHMRGKLANIITELTKGEMFPAAILKNMASGEPITAELKNKDAFTFFMYAKNFFACNNIPAMDDFTEGLARRLRIVEFKNVFGVKGQPIAPTQGAKIATHDVDPELRDIAHGSGPLVDEIDGITWVLLEAYRGVVARGAYTNPKSSQAAVMNWSLGNNQLAQFVEDKCERAFDALVKSSELNTSYRAWAAENHIKNPLSQATIKARLTDMNIVWKKTETGNFFIGLRLKTPVAGLQAVAPMLPFPERS